MEPLGTPFPGGEEEADILTLRESYGRNGRNPKFVTLFPRAEKGEERGGSSQCVSNKGALSE